jgi:trimeric autotransporter adhesin
MVASGRVYVPTFSNTVEVYSVLGSSTTSGSGVISAVVNTASYLEGPVAPGELVTIFGANIGPVAEINAAADGQRFPTTTGGSSVLFDGTAAPVLSTSSDQISTVVPFGVAGPTTEIQVLYQGKVVASTKVPVQAASPALFAQNGAGGGIGSILNQDGSLNTRTNGAAIGSQVSLFATGVGVTTPPSQDGSIAAPPYPAIALPVSVTISGHPAKVMYAGPAAGMVAGMMQIDVIVPANAEIAPFDPVVLTVGPYSSPNSVIISVVK